MSSGDKTIIILNLFRALKTVPREYMTACSQARMTRIYIHVLFRYDGG